jgi:tetratricopeptide (TPR) repeat protein
MSKSSQAASEIPRARLAGFAPAIGRLYILGLPAKRLAELFDTNAGYIHVLSHRARKARSESEPPNSSATAVTSLSDREVIKAKEELNIRAENDGVELTPKKLRNLEWLESRMEDIANTGRNTYRYAEAVSFLKALKPYFGFPSESRRLKILAKLHQHLAWFYTHSGFANSCIAEATHSIRLYDIVYHDTEDKDALRELGGSCLIRSNSRLSDGDGEAALGSLKLSEQATLAADIALNSEYFQQRGVALFQTRQDEAATKMFKRARATTPDSDVKNGSMTLKMSSDRYINLITRPFPDMDDELELLGEARAVYGPDSLEAVMCAHWAAACGLCTDSKTAHLISLDLIQQNQSKVSRFGHQATIAKLLPIALELPPTKRPAYVRFALYQNAYRSN